MSKRIAVIATKAKFKELRKFFRKALPFPLDSSTDDYLAVMELHLYRIDNPKNNFIDAYQWSGYIDLVGWEVESGNNWVNIMPNYLLKCLDLMERKGVPIWNSAKVRREIEELALPF